MPVQRSRLPFKQNPISELGSVTDWYVNAVTGSDSFSGQAQTVTGNDGPFATLDEICDTLCPNNVQLKLLANVTIHIAANAAPVTFARLMLNIDTNGFVFTVDAEKSSSANILLATVVNTVPNSTRGRITTATAGAFTSATQKRLRATTGTNTGARSAVSGAPNSGTDVFVQPWTAASPVGGAPVVNLAANDNVVIDDDLVTLTNIDITLAGLGSFVIQGCILVEGTSRGSAAPAPPVLIDCDITGGSWYGPFTLGAGTRYKSGSFELQSAINMNGVAVQSRLSMTQGSLLVGRAGNANDGVGLAFSGQSHFRPGASWQFENGTGAVDGVLLQGFSTMEIAPGSLGIALWGISGAYGNGFKVQDSSASYDDVVPSIPSTVNVLLDGKTFTYPQLPQQMGGSVFDCTIAATAIEQLTAGQYVATDATNTAATSATINYVALTGTSFSEDVQLSRFVLTASACKLTYTGPPIRCVVKCIAVLKQNVAVTALTSLAIDKTGDLIGTSSNVTTSTKGQIQVEQNSAVLDGAVLIETERVVKLVTGDTLQPTIGSVSTVGNAATGQNVTIVRLALSVTRLQGQ